MLKLMGKKIFTIFAQKFCLSKYTQKTLPYGSHESPQIFGIHQTVELQFSQFLPLQIYLLPLPSSDNRSLVGVSAFCWQVCLCSRFVAAHTGLSHDISWSKIRHTVNVLKFQTLLSFFSQIIYWLSGLEFTKYRPE